MRKQSPPLIALRKAIDALGGKNRVGEQIGVSRQTVHNWYAGTYCPAAKWAIQLEHATAGKIKAAWIRPELAAMDQSR